MGIAPEIMKFNTRKKGAGGCRTAWCRHLLMLVGVVVPAYAGPLPPQTVFILDGPGPADFDRDSDGMRDGYERDHGLDPENPDDAEDDYDGDGLSNAQEAANGTDPFAIDSDGDGVDDGAELSMGLNPLLDSDSDADGLPDDWERYWFGALSETGDDDHDADLSSNLSEYMAGTDPLAFDVPASAGLLALLVEEPGA